MVRKRYINAKGAPDQKKKIVKGRQAANKMRHQIEAEIEAELKGYVKPTGETSFNTWAETYSAKYLIPAVYAGNEKVAGMKSYKNRKSELVFLKEYFGKFALSKITHDDLTKYVTERLATPKTRGTGDRKMATPNRELGLLRRMLTIARHQKLIVSNPFDDGDPVIKAGVDSKRSRILSYAEEAKLFAEAAKSKSKEIAFAITMALETGMRQGEQYSLTDAEVDLPGGIVWATSCKGKTGRKRVRPVPVTSLLRKAFDEHLATRSPESARIFATGNPRETFAALCTRAGLADLHWHDLRHTAITRMVHVFKREPIQVMKIVGHSNWSTFYEIYVNIGADQAREIGAGIDKARAEIAAAELVAAKAQGEAQAAAGPEFIVETDSNN